MALAITIVKISEDKNFAVYKYEFCHPGESIMVRNKQRFKLVYESGQLKINKHNGEISVLERAKHDSGIQMQGAALKLIQHWRKGEYPDKTGYYA